MEPVKNNGSLFDLAKLKELGGFKAGDLLAVDPQLYVKFRRHLSRRVKRDVVTKNMVFSTGISAYTPEPINLFLVGESSIGKTYNVVQPLKYFPKEDVWLLGGLSPTALIHLHGTLVDKNGEQILLSDKPDKKASAQEKEAWRQRLKDSRYLIDLKGKILVFLEAPHYKTFNMLRPILSHDAYEISYKFTDRGGKGNLQTQHVVIRGWPATIFCSTKEKYVQDLATRGFTVTPETTQEKYRDANLLTASQAAFPWKFECDFDFMLLEGYIRFLKNNLGDVKVVVPYAKALAENFPCRFARSMRDFQHVLNLIKIIALFHFAQRPVLIRKVRVEVAGEDATVPEYKQVEERYIMATRRDYEFVMDLWDKIRETTETSAPGHIIKFYHEVISEFAEEKLAVLQQVNPNDNVQISDVQFTVDELVDKWNSKFEDKRSSDTIRVWVGFLSDIGYLSSQPDPDDKRRFLYKVIRENQKFRKYTSLQFSDIFGFNSLKDWLNEVNSITEENQLSLRENLISNNETSIKSIFDKYFLSENTNSAVIDLSDSKASLGESGEKVHENQKLNYFRNFQRKLSVEEILILLRGTWQRGTQEQFQKLAMETGNLSESEAESLFNRLIEEGSLLRTSEGAWLWA